jgi:hypothetical protein
MLPNLFDQVIRKHESESVRSRTEHLVQCQVSVGTINVVRFRSVAADPRARESDGKWAPIGPFIKTEMEIKMRPFIYGVVMAALLSGCGLSGRPSETAAGMGPQSVNCANQDKARHGNGDIDCGP